MTVHKQPICNTFCRIPSPQRKVTAVKVTKLFSTSSILRPTLAIHQIPQINHWKNYAAYSVSVSAVEIILASYISMINQESSWQRVRYYLEVDINQDFQKLSGFIDQQDMIYASKGIKGLFTLQGNHALQATLTLQVTFYPNEDIKVFNKHQVIHHHYTLLLAI